VIVGNADADQLAVGAADVSEFHPDALELTDVVCFQLTAEMRNSAREAVLPAGLHPTVPAALSVQVYEVGGSPWGEFCLATVRISCRSGVRARGFTRAAIVSNEAACSGLRAILGLPARVGRLNFRHSYDGVSIAVFDGSQQILGIEGLDPEPMAANDVQYTGTLNLAHTPLGLRLMQVEMISESSRVERLTSRVTEFEGMAWGEKLLEPAMVIASSLAAMEVSYPPVRFVCKPDELAFTGTESVTAATESRA
jgi:hypothetical protein